MSVDIQFTYPPMYPDEEPGVEIVNQTGLSPEQAAELETYLKEQVQQLTRPSHIHWLSEIIASGGAQTVQCCF